MPPKSAKPAPRLLMPAEPPRDRARFTTTHLALLAVPIALWLLYGWLRPVPAIVIPPPAATAPAEVAAAAATPPVPATRQDAAPPAADADAADADAAAQDPLADYPRAEGTWGDVLNPQKLIPGTGYTAYFLDTGQSRAYGIADDGKPRNEVQVMHSVMPAYTPEPGHIRAAGPTMTKIPTASPPTVSRRTGPGGCMTRSGGSTTSTFPRSAPKPASCSTSTSSQTAGATAASPSNFPPAIICSKSNTPTAASRPLSASASTPTSPKCPSRTCPASWPVSPCRLRP